jgi:hypothetical protein
LNGTMACLQETSAASFTLKIPILALTRAESQDPAALVEKLAVRRYC